LLKKSVLVHLFPVPASSSVPVHTLGRSSVAILLNSVWKTVSAFCIISAWRCITIRFSEPLNHVLVGGLDGALVDRCVAFASAGVTPLGAT
jgi:hypothetical protein